MNFLNTFQEQNPEGNFFDLKKQEDISTLYHGEFKSGDAVNNYWSVPPVGFSHKCDFVLGLFGKDMGLAVAVIVQPEHNVYIPILHVNAKLNKSLEYFDVVPYQVMNEKQILEVSNFIEAN